MPLPSPTLSFTIPSIYDDTVLQCRVYHPKCLAPTSISQITGWNKKAAIVAHPYAMLGGCYDDPIVDIVSSTILEQGFVVGTFNFRYILGPYIGNLGSRADILRKGVQVLQKGELPTSRSPSRATICLSSGLWSIICTTSPPQLSR
jgi:hypothetical protein